MGKQKNITFTIELGEDEIDGILQDGLLNSKTRETVIEGLIDSMQSGVARVEEIEELD